MENKSIDCLNKMKTSYRIVCLSVQTRRAIIHTIHFLTHIDVIKWKHFPRHWAFVRGIHRSPVNSPHRGQWYGALMISLICAYINGWVNNREAGDSGRHRAHYDVTVMIIEMRILPTVLLTDMSAKRWQKNHAHSYLFQPMIVKYLKEDG